MTTPDTVEIQRTDMISAKKNNPNPQIAQSKNSESMAISAPSEHTPADMPMADMMMRSTAPTPTDTSAPLEWAAMMMAVVAPVPLDDTTTIDTEIADMMGEISAIIHPATVALVLPVYPRQMPIYEKGIVFTPAEITSRTGASLTLRTVDTISDATLLRKKITTLIGSDQIVWEGQVIYQQFTSGGIYALVPVLSYTLTSRNVISVSLVSGYE
jgi:hypothetical protein